MPENKTPLDNLVHTLSRDPGSPESRAAARKLLAERPVLITEYTEPTFDAEGHHIYGGRVCDSRTALVNGKPLDRLENESLAEFKERAVNAVPAMHVGVVEMLPDGEPDDGNRQCKISGSLGEGSASHPPGKASAEERQAGLKIVSRILSGVWGLGDTILDFPADKLLDLNSQLRVVYGLAEELE